MARIGVINVVPEANGAPPVGTLYQFIVPPEAAAAKATDPESQREFGVVEVIVGIGLIVAITSLLSTVGQLPLVTST